MADIPITTNTITIYVTNITEITNTITNIPQLDKVWYKDISLLGVIATFITACIMYKANKISSKSVDEMKKQYELNNLKIEIEDSVLRHIRKASDKIPILYSEIGSKTNSEVEKYREDFLEAIEKIGSGIRAVLRSHMTSSYQGKTIQLLELLKKLAPIIYNSKKYSSFPTIIKTYFIIKMIGSELYTAIANKSYYQTVLPIWDSMIQNILDDMPKNEKDMYDFQKNQLEQELDTMTNKIINDITK